MRGAGTGGCDMGEESTPRQTGRGRCAIGEAGTHHGEGTLIFASRSTYVGAWREGMGRGQVTDTMQTEISMWATGRQAVTTGREP
jgi:hypothetical protein